MRKLYFFILLIAASHAVQAQDTTSAGKNTRPADDFWEVGVLAGASIHDEFIANTENVISPVYGVRFAKHARKFMFGIGYDAQTFALKTTQEGWAETTYKYAKPQHTFYVLGNRVFRKGWGDFHFGLLVGYSAGKAEDSEGFSKFESSKGMVAGINTGVSHRLYKMINIALEFNPKIYNLEFKKTNGKAESERVLTAPLQLGVKFRF